MRYLNLIIFLFVASVLLSQEKVVSNVEEVVLYSNQAMIKRTGNIVLQKGVNELVFYGLEEQIITNSLKISVVENATILSSHVALAELPKSVQSETVRKILDNLDQLKREEYTLKKRIQNYQSEKDLILNHRQATGEGGFETTRLQNLAAFYRKNLNELDRLIYDDQQELNKLNESITKLQKSLSDGGYRSHANALFLNVEANDKVAAVIKLNYLVPNAGWTPFYDIKTNGIDPKLSATTRANIYQNTGLNWDKASVTLSTAQPIKGQQIPKVHPWVLRFLEEGIDQRFANDAMQSNRAYELAEVETVSMSRGSKSLKKEVATAVDNLTSREFQINHPVSVKGVDGTTVVTLENFIMQGDYRYFAAPKYNPNVFLTAYVTDWEKHNLLPANANLYLGGDFVGTSFIHPQQDTDSLHLPFGKDDGVVVKRERITDVTSRSFIGRFKTVEMGVQLQVRNNKNVPINLTLKDQVPISSDTDIEIKIHEISNAEHAKNTGELSWDLPLAPSESKTIIIKYSVKYPKNRRLANF